MTELNQSTVITLYEDLCITDMSLDDSITIMGDGLILRCVSWKIREDNNVHTTWTSYHRHKYRGANSG